METHYKLILKVIIHKKSKKMNKIMKARVATNNKYNKNNNKNNKINRVMNLTLAKLYNLEVMLKIKLYKLIIFLYVFIELLIDIDDK